MDIREWTLFSTERTCSHFSVPIPLGKRVHGWLLRIYSTLRGIWKKITYSFNFFSSFKACWNSHFALNTPKNQTETRPSSFNNEKDLIVACKITTLLDWHKEIEYPAWFKGKWFRINILTTLYFWVIWYKPKIKLTWAKNVMH